MMMCREADGALIYDGMGTLLLLFSMVLKQRMKVYGRYDAIFDRNG